MISSGSSFGHDAYALMLQACPVCVTCEVSRERCAGGNVGIGKERLVCHVLVMVPRQHRLQQ